MILEIHFPIYSGSPDSHLRRPAIKEWKEPNLLGQREGGRDSLRVNSRSTVSRASESRFTRSLSSARLDQSETRISPISRTRIVGSACKIGWKLAIERPMRRLFSPTTAIRIKDSRYRYENGTHRSIGIDKGRTPRKSFYGRISSVRVRVEGGGRGREVELMRKGEGQKQTRFIGERVKEVSP